MSVNVGVRGGRLGYDEKGIRHEKEGFDSAIKEVRGPVSLCVDVRRPHVSGEYRGHVSVMGCNDKAFVAEKSLLGGDREMESEREGNGDGRSAHKRWEHGSDCVGRRICGRNRAYNLKYSREKSALPSSEVGASLLNVRVRDCGVNDHGANENGSGGTYGNLLRVE